MEVHCNHMDAYLLTIYSEGSLIIGECPRYQPALTNLPNLSKSLKQSLRPQISAIFSRQGEWWVTCYVFNLSMLTAMCHFSSILGRWEQTSSRTLSGATSLLPITLCALDKHFYFFQGSGSKWPLNWLHRLYCTYITYIGGSLLRSIHSPRFTRLHFCQRNVWTTHASVAYTFASYPERE